MGSTPQRSPAPPSGPGSWLSLCSAMNRITVSRAGRARARRKPPLLSRSHWPDAAWRSPYAAPCSPRPSATSHPRAGPNRPSSRGTRSAASPGSDPQHARDHAHRAFSKLIGVLARTSDKSNPPKIVSLRTHREGSQRPSAFQMELPSAETC